MAVHFHLDDGERCCLRRNLRGESERTTRRRKKEKEKEEDEDDRIEAHPICEKYADRELKQTFRHYSNSPLVHIYVC